MHGCSLACKVTTAGGGGGSSAVGDRAGAVFGYGVRGLVVAEGSLESEPLPSKWIYYVVVDRLHVCAPRCPPVNKSSSRHLLRRLRASSGVSAKMDIMYSCLRITY